MFFDIENGTSNPVSKLARLDYDSAKYRRTTEMVGIDARLTALSDRCNRYKW